MERRPLLKAALAGSTAGLMVPGLFHGGILFLIRIYF